MNSFLPRRRAALGAAAAAVGAALFATLPAHAQARKMVVQIGVPAPNVVATPVYVAQQAGFFKEENLDVELRYASGAPQALQLTAAGQSDVAIGTMEPLIAGHEKGLRAKAFARTNRRLIYYIAVPADSPVRKIEDLKNATIGVANLAGAAFPVNRAILRAANVEPGPDKMVPVGVGEQAVAALTTGKVQALGLWSNQYYAMERSGVKLRYFYHPTMADFGSSVLMTSDKALSEKRNELCGFARAFAKATLFMTENPEASLRMFWNAAPGARIGASDAEAVKSGMIELSQQIADIDIGFPPNATYGQIDRAALMRYQQLLKDQGLTQTTPPVEDVATDALLDCMNKFDTAQVRARAKSWKP